MRKRVVLLILIMINLGTIFFFSHQNATASTQLSNALSKHIEVNTPNYEQKNQGEKNVLHNSTQRSLRRAAHVFLFFTLGILVLLFCLTFGGRWFRSVLCTVLFGLICAVGDEIHQSFIPGRTAQWSDVGCDMLGIVLGLAVTGLICLFVALVKQKRAE